MNRFILILLILIIFIGIGTSVYFVYSKEKISKIVQKEIKTEIIPVSPIVRKIKNMSLDEKIGQMLIIGFENKYLDDHVQKMIEQYHIGGINLLGRNVKDKNQIQQLTTDLQKISDTPLFIATDQEGGKVIRFNFLYELTSQIRIKDTQQAEQIALTRARELREIGVNMNFSPVIDYVSDTQSYLYNRTFGVDPNFTGVLGSAMIRGYQKGGIIPVAKHFPGYGNIVVDPHRKEAISSVSNETFNRNLIPFKKILENNLADTIAIMTAHIVLTAIDSKPATLSQKFMTEILRKQMGFDGVIITDDMEMVATRQAIDQAAAEAVKAGVDMIISTYTPVKQILIFNRLKTAVLTGEISEERINESIMRILKLKSLLVSN
ncbi:MAG TPA: glycoside hydrolase family 3 N-terminal domain-containing protein [Candidatus Paceibacterota bacterium]